MTRRGLVWLLLVFCLPGWARAHIGSPDVFSEGMIGPYPARVTIRMPAVVPGRAEIIVRVLTNSPVEVSFLPIFARTSVTNVPPPDPGLAVAGETNLYSGELWLMSFGAYSIEVAVRGPAGEGKVEIPVNAVALSQLPLPSFLGKILLALGALLILGGLGILSAAAGESALPPGIAPGRLERRKSVVVVVVASLIFTVLLAGGKKWWESEELDFRRHLRPGAWPDLAGTVRVDGSNRILTLKLGEQTFPRDSAVPLLPDHGKLLHLFLIREPGLEAFAHLHPVRQRGNTFEVMLPPLPEGRYKMMCDLTVEGSGVSSTATNSVDLPPVPAPGPSTAALQPDPDDSWAVYPADAVPSVGSADSVFRLPGGGRVVWKAHDAPRVNRDAELRFEVQDEAGHPAALEPYMGMLSHAAVLREDGAVFSHLHPSGNFSMAAQMFFEAKKRRESGGSDDNSMPSGMDHSKMDHSKMNHAKMAHAMASGDSPGGVSVVTLPYQFPAPGRYRLWAQFKIAGQVLTSVFDTTVAGP